MGQDSSLKQKTFNGFFWMFSGKGSQAILQFVVTIILARLLSPSDFGVVNAATVVITFTTAFSMIGVGPALIQRPNLNESHVRTGFTLSILLSIVFAVLLYFSSSIISSFFGMTKLINILKVMSVIFLLRGLSIVAESLLQRRLNFKLFAGIQVASYIAYGFIGVLSAFIGLGYWSLVYALIGQTLIRTILLIMIERHSFKLQLHKTSAKELLIYGGGFTIARLSNQIALQADNLVVGRWLGSDALGLYGRAYQLMVMPTNLFGQVMDKVLFPAMSRIQKKQDQLAHVYRIGITAVAFFTIPVGILICLLAKDIVILLFGEKWLDLVPALQVLAMGLVFRTGYKISDSLARATGAVYRRAWRQIIYALAVLLGAWIGQHWGILGVSYGVLGAIILNYFLMTNLSMRYTSLSVKDVLISHIPGAFLGLLAALSVFLIDWISIRYFIPSILRILLSGIMFLSFIFILIKLNAGKILGKDVVWIKDQLLQMIRTRKRKDI